MEFMEMADLVYFAVLLSPIVLVVAAVAAYKWSQNKRIEHLREEQLQARLRQLEERDRVLEKFRRETFSWYRDTHPTCVSEGRVICFSCGGRRLHTERLMHGTYTRRHFCVTCGTTLYYSPEGSRAPAF